MQHEFIQKTASAASAPYLNVRLLRARAGHHRARCIIPNAPAQDVACQTHSRARCRGAVYRTCRLLGRVKLLRSSTARSSGAGAPARPRLQRAVTHAHNASRQTHEQQQGMHRVSHLVPPAADPGESVAPAAPARRRGGDLGRAALTSGLWTQEFWGRGCSLRRARRLRASITCKGGPREN